MYISLDGDSLYGALSVTTTPVEVKVGGSRYEDRQIVTIQPTNGDIVIGYSNALTAENGTIIFKNQFFPIEATKDSEIWIRSVTGTVDVRIAELG